MRIYFFKQCFFLKKIFSVVFVFFLILFLSSLFSFFVLGSNYSVSASTDFFSNHLVDRLELKFIKDDFSRITDVSKIWVHPIISRDISPYSSTQYTDYIKQKIDRVSSSFKESLRVNNGSWWVVSDFSGYTKGDFNSHSGTLYYYDVYYHPDSNLRFLNPDSTGFVRLSDGNSPIRNASRVRISYTYNVTGSPVSDYHFISETPKIYSVDENNIYGFRLDSDHKIFLARVSNSADLNIPFVDPLSSFNSSDSILSFSKKIYPRINLYFEKGNLIASTDLGYFSKNNIPNPDVSIFSLTNSRGKLIDRSENLNGLAVWSNLSKGVYRIVLNSAWFPSNAPADYDIKPVFFDLDLDPSSDSFLISFDSNRDKYCFSSNRLKDNSIGNLQSMTSNFFDQLIAVYQTTNVSPGELYYRCDDLPQPENNSSDPSDFSVFNPQGFSDYETNCASTDLGCHINLFITRFFNKVLSFIKTLLVPKLEDIQRGIDSSLNFLKSSLGSFSKLYDVLESFIKSFLVALVPSLDSYTPPCDVFGNLTFMGASVRLDICSLERAIGSNNFNKLRLFVSASMYFSAVLVIRSTFLTILFMLIGGKK